MKKRIIVFLLTLGLALCLFAGTSKDVELRLNFKTLLFTHEDPIGKLGEIADPRRHDNYYAYNGRSLTLVLTEVNPFLYTVVINGRSYEYFYDQNEFESRMEMAIKEFEKKDEKTENQVENKTGDVLDSIKNSPNATARSQVQKKPELQNSIKTRNAEIVVETINSPEFKRYFEREIRELNFLIDTANLQKYIKGFHDDFRHLYKGLFKLTKSPSLGYSEIVTDFIVLAKSRFPEISHEPGKEPTISDFQNYAQARIAEFKEKKLRIEKGNSDLFIGNNDLPGKMTSMEESIEAIEGVCQLFNEALVLFKEDCFTVRDVFPTIYGDEFVIRIKVFRKDSMEVAKELQPIRIHMLNGTKIDFSAGLALGVNGADEEYILVKSEENGGKQKLVKNSATLVTPSPYALIHAYPRWLGRWIKWDLICFGLGLNPNQTVNYYLGTGLSLNTKRPLNQENGDKIISDRRVIVNFGLVLTKIKTLAPRFQGMTEVDSDVKVEELLKESYKPRLFLGVSYNL